MKATAWCLSGLIWCSAFLGAASPRISNHFEGYVQYGLASWYGGRHQGHLMASGERFNEYAMIAASLSLPLGTRVEVTNLKNGRSVVVRIMDRGPYVRGRAIDVSRAAANRLGFTKKGLAPVRIRVLHPRGDSSELRASVGNH